MKTSNRRATALYAAVLFTFVAAAAHAQTEFTYQGRLDSQSQQANGEFDFQFELYTAESSGSQIGSTIALEDVVAIDGLFNVVLDFGSVFDGTPSWLEIGVRDGASGGAYSILQPRQRITPAPLALNADTVDGSHASDFASQADIASLNNQIAALQSQLASLQAPTILGRSAQTSNGRFTFNGFTGVQAADAMCRTTFPAESTAHLCTRHEIERAVALDNVAAGVDGVATWTIAAFERASATYNDTLTNSCQNLMYNSADVATGTRATVDLGYVSPGNGGGVTGDVVRFESSIGCGQNMPVLCCR